MALFKRKTKEKEVTDKKKETPKEEVAALPSGAALPRGGDAHSYRVVLSPHITEKGSMMGEQNQYVFKVNNNANKTEIGRAVANLYKVKVDKVRVSYSRAKSRQVGRHKGWKTGFKKAVVTLKEGSKIDIAQ